MPVSVLAGASLGTWLQLLWCLPMLLYCVPSWSLCKPFRQIMCTLLVGSVCSMECLLATAVLNINCRMFVFIYPILFASSAAIDQEKQA